MPRIKIGARTIKKSVIIFLNRLILNLRTNDSILPPPKYDVLYETLYDMLYDALYDMLYDALYDILRCINDHAVIY